jgi:hypothetical protein
MSDITNRLQFIVAGNDDSETGQGSNINNSSSGILKPYFEKLVPSLLVALCYPENPDDEENEEAESDVASLVSFRDFCINVIGDATLIIRPSWMIDRIGETLSEVCTTTPASPSAIAAGSPPYIVSAPWHKIEACIQVLTAVAPRTTAGGDAVIPRVIEIIPMLDYPSQGQPAMLLRYASAKLALYTAAFIAMNFFTSSSSTSVNQELSSTSSIETNIGFIIFRFFCDKMLPSMKNFQPKNSM